jgi:adenine-specific DNA-methyltransferase
MQFFNQRMFSKLPVKTHRQRAATGQVLLGDCVHVMGTMPAGTVDFILTDPPYITHYRDRSGRSVANDNNGDWLMPAFAHMHRLLKPNSLCVSFYGWPKVDLFMAAWRAAGFRPVSHIVFPKSYASRAGFMRGQHETAFLLAKGDAPRPEQPIADVLEWKDTGNKLHPTQKPVEVLRPLIEVFTQPGQLVLDPFCGSGSTLAAAAELGRAYLGIELDAAHHQTATRRMAEGRQS